MIQHLNNMITLLILASTTIMFVDNPCIKEYPTEILMGCYHPDTDVIEIAGRLNESDRKYALYHEIGHYLNGSDEETAEWFTMYVLSPSIPSPWMEKFIEVCDEKCLLEIKSIKV